jgi:hypothetical protein
LLGVLAGDSQAQPGAGSTPSAIANGKPLEQAVEVAWIRSGTSVGDLNDDRTVFLLG